MMKQLLRWFSPAAETGPVAETKDVALGNLIAWSHSGYTRWSHPDSATMARRGYMSNPIVFRCIRLIAETAAAIPLLIYQNNGELDAHPMLDLLLRPNPRQGGKEFREMLIGHLLVSGNAYVELVEVGDEPRELHGLRPDRVKLVCDRNGWVEAYEYAIGDTRRIHPVGADGRCDVLHLSLFHPLDDCLGFPPLQAALMSLDVHNAASQWNKSLLDNSARPSGALVYAPSSGANMSD